MKTIDDIYTSYSNGDYKTKLSLPTDRKLKEGHVFDEDKSVKWNRDKVQEHNDNIVNKRKAVFEDQSRLDSKLRSDVITVLVEEYNFTKEQAEIIESQAYQDRHSSISDYINGIYGDADYAVKLLGTVVKV